MNKKSLDKMKKTVFENIDRMDLSKSVNDYDPYTAWYLPGTKPVKNEVDSANGKQTTKGLRREK